MDDLGTYPLWLGIVLAARPAPAAGGDPGPAWSVDLGARVGPLTRSKRVRMVRAGHEPLSSVRFERLELDGRAHSAWVLAGSVEAAGAGTLLTMHLHYGGAPPIPFLDQLLTGEARRAAGRLERRLAGGAD